MVLLVTTIDDSWSRVGVRLKATFGPDIYDSWLTSLKLEGVRETVMYCSSPTDFLCRWIKKNYAETITDCIKLEYRDVTTVRFLHRKPGVPLLPKETEPEQPQEVGQAPAATVAPPPPSGVDTSNTESATASENNVPKLSPSKKGYKILIEEISMITCRHFGISRSALLSRGRSFDIVGPRQVCMFLAKYITDKSLEKIGESFGGKDHTTVLSAVKKISARTVADIEFAYDVAKLEAAIRGSAIV